MRSEDVKLKYSNSFANDFLYNFSEVAEFFTYNPYDPQSWLERYTQLVEKPHAARQTVVEVLKDYNKSLGAGLETMHNIELLSQPETVAVVTGQQAGLMGGPLYTVYKALTAVQLAREYSRKLHKPVIPVFWIASEDHDYGEINHFHILDRQGQPTRIRLEAEPKGKLSIGQIAIPEEVEGLIAKLADLVQDTEFKTELLDSVSKSAAESSNLADWFGRILLSWLGKTGLVLVDPMDPRLRRLETEIFLQAADKCAEVNSLLAKAASELAAKSYPVAIEKQPDNLNFFMYHQGERLALVQGENGYGLKGTDLSLNRESLVELIKTRPESFSPNVVLRPLTQEILFPTLAYVGGPGEINYFGQYRKVFELFGLQMPIIYPRASITLVEGSIENHLRKYNLTLPEILDNLDSIKKQYLSESDQVGIDGVFEQLQNSVVNAYGKAIEAIKGIDHSLEKLGRENQERVVSQITWLKGKTQQAHRKENEVALRQLEKLGNNLNPSGSLQERFLSGMYFALKYGAEIFAELDATDLLASPSHNLVFIKD